jgi:hypothetical protein
VVEAGVVHPQLPPEGDVVGVEDGRLGGGAGIEGDGGKG